MRRFLTLAAAISFIGIMGCKHTAGVCDCDMGCSQCHNYGPMGVIHPEPLPVMPKVNNGDGADKAKENEPKEIQLDKELPLGNEK